ncbi:hypothetical protein [Parahaliea aestuarii]|uniref:Uncharacterized protein n=1 Tax=Parahaliea aestuarii TaxID=1852021 RepID=A0A5C8ZTZ7_9GAMM|nr:hypothetical protein [Parahaliea aestuarii]TXS91032.1 hypothetical protein FVW59_12545 [Parahaliea aestuarii]
MKIFGFKNLICELFFSTISILLVLFVLYALFTALYRANSGFDYINENLSDSEKVVLIGENRVHDLGALRNDISDWKYFKQSGSHPTKMFEARVCHPECNLLFVLYRDSRNPRMYWVSLAGEDLEDYIGYIETDLVN